MARLGMGAGEVSLPVDAVGLKNLQCGSRPGVQESIILRVDLPEHGLQRGDVGTIVEVRDAKVLESDCANRGQYCACPDEW
jgi:hypothetical protein